MAEVDRIGKLATAQVHQKIGQARTFALVGLLGLGVEHQQALRRRRYVEERSSPMLIAEELSESRDVGRGFPAERQGGIDEEIDPAGASSSGLTLL
tara:strand:+ start:318 stop:605 length:288 start_codon:yes stop_codon:yes gene_type:complete